MASIGDRIEIDYVTRDYIEFARSATSELARNHWVTEMLSVHPDGVRHWKYDVVEASLT